jgi:hypothetical protein
MEDKAKVSFWKQALNYGLIMAAVSIFLSLVFYFTNLYVNTWANYISMVIGLVVLFYLMVQYRKVVRGGFASFGQMYSMSFTSSMISIVIGVLFGLLLMNVIAPEMKDAILLNVEERIMNNPRIPESYLDQAIERAQKSLEPGRQIIFGIAGGALFNAILCLIVAAIVKKDEPVA